MKMRVYAAGGAGINVVSALFKQIAAINKDGFAEMQPAYLDTSVANLSGVKDRNEVYLFKEHDEVGNEKRDGAGKDRASVKKLVAENIREPLLQFKPADINLVVHSGSGGSGSMIGPVLVHELLKRKVPTIVIVIGSSDSTKEITNTKDCLSSYEKIAAATQRPVVCRYFENTRETSEGEVNKEVVLFQLLLARFFSGELERLDTSDIANFLNFPAVSPYPSMLAGMEIFAQEIENPNRLPIVSLLTVTDNNTSSSPSQVVSYQAVGVISEAQAKQLDLALPLHCAIFAGYFHPVQESLEAKKKVAQEISDAYVHRPIVSTGDDDDLFCA